MISSTAKATLSFWVNAVPRTKSALAIAEGLTERNRSQEEQSRVQTGGSAVVLSNVVLETAEEKRRSEHEKRVGDNGAFRLSDIGVD